MPEEEKPKGGLRGPIELWTEMFRQLTPRTIGRVLPAWLGGVVGFVVASTGDVRGSLVQTVVGVVIFVSCFIVFRVRVFQILRPTLRR